MAQEIKTKATFGGCDINHLSPAATENWPKAINAVISFEDALKLHLSLGQILGKLNSYNRTTKAGRQSAVNLCIYTERQRITVSETKTRPETAKAE